MCGGGCVAYIKRDDIGAVPRWWVVSLGGGGLRSSVCVGWYRVVRGRQKTARALNIVLPPGRGAAHASGGGAGCMPHLTVRAKRHCSAPFAATTAGLLAGAKHTTNARGL